MPPSLSVAIPNYNHGRYLERCLTAVMTQDRPPDEVIVYDDASTDDSLEVLRRLRERWPLIEIIRGERNRGVVQAANMLAERASGEWLHLLAADDTPLPGFYRLAMRQAEAWPHAGFVFGSFIGVEDESGDRWLESADRWIDPGYQSPADMLWKLYHRAPGLFALGFTVVLQRKRFLEAGGHRPDLGPYDTLTYRCLAVRYGAVYLGGAPVTCVRSSANSYSGQVRVNPEQRAELMARAAQLMRTEYADLFPERFIRHWEKKVGEELGLLPMSRTRWAKLALAWLLRRGAAHMTRFLGR